jgi:hypothetical protein
LLCDVFEQRKQCFGADCSEVLTKHFVFFERINNIRQSLDVVTPAREVGGVFGIPVSPNCDINSTRLNLGEISARVCVGWQSVIYRKGCWVRGKGPREHARASIFIRIKQQINFDGIGVHLVT